MDFYFLTSLLVSVSVFGQEKKDTEIKKQDRKPADANLQVQELSTADGRFRTGQYGNFKDGNTTCYFVKGLEAGEVAIQCFRD